jgi:hypothetical protein
MAPPSLTNLKAAKARAGLHSSGDEDHRVSGVFALHETVAGMKLPC